MKTAELLPSASIVTHEDIIDATKMVRAVPVLVDELVRCIYYLRQYRNEIEDQILSFKGDEFRMMNKKSKEIRDRVIEAEALLKSL